MRWRNGLFALLCVFLVSVVCYLVSKHSDPIGDPPGILPRHRALRAPVPADESEKFFADSDVKQIVLQLEETEAQKLRSEARAYVKCSLVENAGEPMQVGIKLKGAAGSFRELDDRPAFTINVNKFRKQQRFYLLEKFYLNNSVQDESYYSEWLSASICNQLNLPAPRIAFAHVWLNERDLGLYVLKEGFDKSFIARHFKDADGSLYDGGFLQDIDVDLEKDLGNPSDDLDDLHRLRAAALEPDEVKQRSAIEQALEVDAFLTFMAFETMACHWDGYVPNKNNYRLYFPTSSGAWFLPHGMDQMFQETELSIFEPRQTLVTQAVRNQPDWNERYRQRVREMQPLFEPRSLMTAIEKLEQRLRVELIKIDPECGPVRDEVLAQWRERLERRYASMSEQLEQPDPPSPPEPTEEEPINLAIDETISLLSWYPRQETTDSNLSETADEGGYRIEVGEGIDCVASWRRIVRLPPGKYRFAAELRGDEIRPRDFDDRGQGAGLRISGVNRSQGFVDTFDWQQAVYDFDVGTQEPLAPGDSVSDDVLNAEQLFQVELVSELRAISGWSEMRAASLTRLSAEQRLPAEQQTPL